MFQPVSSVTYIVHNLKYNNIKNNIKKEGIFVIKKEFEKN